VAFISYLWLIRALLEFVRYLFCAVKTAIYCFSRQANDQKVSLKAAQSILGCVAQSKDKLFRTEIYFCVIDKNQRLRRSSSKIALALTGKGKAKN
jgi:hypothetical protein